MLRYAYQLITNSVQFLELSFCALKWRFDKSESEQKQ